MPEKAEGEGGEGVVLEMKESIEGEKDESVAKTFPRVGLVGAIVETGIFELLV